MPELSPSRLVARQAVKKQIAEAAAELFIDRGFEATKVWDIAEVVGISERTFFRYFATKEEVLFVDADHAMESFLSSLDQAPEEATTWDVLRRLVLASAQQHPLAASLEWSKRVEKIMAQTPSLVGPALQRVECLEQEISRRLIERDGFHGEAVTLDVRVSYRSLVGAAFAALSAATRYARSDKLSASHQVRLVEIALGAIDSAAREILR